MSDRAFEVEVKHVAESLEDLTLEKRQQDVLQHMALGMTDGQICDIFNVTKDMLVSCMESVYADLGLDPAKDREVLVQAQLLLFLAATEIPSFTELPQDEDGEGIVSRAVH